MKKNNWTLLSQFIQRAVNQGYSKERVADIFKRATATDEDNLHEVLKAELLELEHKKTVNMLSTLLKLHRH